MPAPTTRAESTTGGTKQLMDHMTGNSSLDSSRVTSGPYLPPVSSPNAKTGGGTEIQFGVGPRNRRAGSWAGNGERRERRRFDTKTRSERRRTKDRSRRAFARAASRERRPLKAPGAFSVLRVVAALSMPLAGRSAGDATGLLVDAPRQPPCVSVRLRAFVSSLVR